MKTIGRVMQPRMDGIVPDMVRGIEGYWSISMVGLWEWLPLWLVLGLNG